MDKAWGEAMWPKFAGLKRIFKLSAGGDQIHCDQERDKTLIDLCGEPVTVDRSMAEVLKALNSVGLKTRGHCCGHDEQDAWIAIAFDENVYVEVSKHGLLIQFGNVKKFQENIRRGINGKISLS